MVWYVLETGMCYRQWNLQSKTSKITLIKPFKFVILLSLLGCFAFVHVTKRSLVYSNPALLCPLTAGDNKTIRAQWETLKASVLIFVLILCSERNEDFSWKHLLTSYLKGAKIEGSSEQGSEEPVAQQSESAGVLNAKQKFNLSLCEGDDRG